VKWVSAKIVKKQIGLATILPSEGSGILKCSNLSAAVYYEFENCFKQHFQLIVLELQNHEYHQILLQKQLTFIIERKRYFIILGTIFTFTLNQPNKSPIFIS
jgi:hypothetical protein